MNKLLTLIAGLVFLLCIAGTASALSFSHKQQTKFGQDSHKVIMYRLGSVIQPLKYTYTASRINIRESGPINWAPGSVAALVISNHFPKIFSNFTNPFGDGWENGYDHHGANPSHASPVPEPATMLLLGAGLIGLAGTSRKRWIKR